MATKVRGTPAESSQKWADRTKAAVGEAQRGIAAVVESPMEKAAGQKTKMLANLTKSVNDGRWEAGLKSVSLTEWKTVTSAKIAERLPGGVDAAMPRRQKFDAWLHTTLNTILPEVDKMPTMSIQDSINKVAKVITHLHNNRYKR